VQVQGQPAFDLPLNASQQAAFRKFADELPLDELKDSYEDSRVLDGFICQYSLQVGGRPVRNIEVRNSGEAHLTALNHLINHVIPRDAIPWHDRPGSVQPSVTGP